NHDIKINDNNEYKLITVSIPKGRNILSFSFENTLVRTVGSIISFFSLLILVLCSYWIHKKRREA
ncbi:MAG: hypothetical protein NTV98_01480, partial [Candidatus Roizmanbacteria bacterium]|nr:hypothetical protein [Candidatus Roizmanbacteria bacterium]